MNEGTPLNLTDVLRFHYWYVKVKTNYPVISREIKELGRSIDINVESAFGFPKQAWYELWDNRNRFVVPGFFIGFSHQLGGDYFTYEDATATIMFDNDPEPKIAIAGLMPDSRAVLRIVSLQYRVRDSRLTRFNVSVSPAELPFSGIDDDNFHQINMATATAPSDPNFPYRGAGYMTQGMVENVGHEVHKRARLIDIYSPSGDQQLQFNGYTSTPGAFLEQYGFTYTQTRNVATVGYNGQWELRVPTTLSQA